MKVSKWFAEELRNAEQDPHYYLEGLLMDLQESLLDTVGSDKVSSAELANVIGKDENFCKDLLSGKITDLKAWVEIFMLRNKKLKIEIDDIKIEEYELLK